MAAGAILRPSEASNETEPIKYACAQQTHGKRAPNAYKAPAAVYAEEPAERQRHHEIGEKGYPDERTHARNAAQGVGKGVLKAVAKLIDDERYDGLRHEHTHLGAVCKPVAERIAQQEHGHREHEGYEHDDMKAGIGSVAHGGGVALTVEIAHPDGYCGSHAAVDHIEQLRGRERYLMGGKGRYANPAHEDGRERKGRALHAELHGNGPAKGVDAAEVGTVEPSGGISAAVRGIAAVEHEHGNEGNEHNDARHHGADAGAEKAQLGHAEGSVDEHIVAEDVEHVAAQDDEHRHARVGYSVVKLLEGVEHAQEGQRHDVHQKI